MECIEVFIKRGQLSKSFSVHLGNRTILEGIVQRLDNLPLAIRLPLRALNLFTIEEIEQRLVERFSLLRSRKDETPALQGALDWSWDLLKPWSQEILAQTSVFRGGFELGSAEKVLKCNKGTEAQSSIFYRTCATTHSYNSTDMRMGSIRYRLLDSVRQYAAGHLHKTIASMQTRRRHVSAPMHSMEQSFLNT